MKRLVRRWSRKAFLGAAAITIAVNVVGLLPGSPVFGLLWLADLPAVPAIVFFIPHHAYPGSIFVMGVALAAGILLSACVWGLIAARIFSTFADVSHLCHKCNYNLTGNVSGVCPECGEQVPTKRVESA